MKQIKQLFTGRRKNMYILAILFVLCLATELLLANWRDFSIKDAPVTVLPSETLTSAKGATLLPDGTIQIDAPVPNWNSPACPQKRIPSPSIHPHRKGRYPSPPAS